MSAAALPPSPLVGRRERLWPTVVVSLALHAAFIGVAALRTPTAPIVDQKPIVARLVRLGEARPKEFLPRKDAAPPPAPPAAAPPAPSAAPPPPKVAEAPRPDAMPPPRAAPAKPQPAPGPRAANGKPQPSSGGLASALSRISKEQAFGSPEGDPLGDAEEGEGDRYLALVDRAVREQYVVPATISEQERMHLRATVVLFIEPDGRISRYDFTSRSGNPTFDSALERGIKAVRLPPPPPDKRMPYRTQGFRVIFTP